MLLTDLLDSVVDPPKFNLGESDVRAAGSAKPSPVEVTSIVIDDRDAVPGALFACVRGAGHDGHDHARAAVGRGAVAMLTERAIVGLPADFPQIIVASVREMIGPVASRLFGAPSLAMQVVGVTGTNGKTTVTFLLESIARASGRSAGVLGTLGARWGSTNTMMDTTAALTTPEAPALQQTFAAMRADGVQVAAIEVSSHALEFHRVDGTRFAAVGFTNLSPEHLDLHGDLEQYFAAKSRLFTRSFSGRAVICVDDVFGRRLEVLAAQRGLTVTTVSTRDETAGLVAHDVVMSGTGTTFRAVGEHGELDVSLSLLGAFNVANALVAIGLARAIGAEDVAIAAGLRAATRVPGRLDTVPNDRDFTVVVDYAHTPDALATVLTTLRGLAAPSARIVAVFGCGGDRDRAKRPLMGQAVARGADLSVLTSDNPRSESPEAIAADVLAGLDAGDRRPEVQLDRRAAIRRAFELAEPGDIVLIAGKGHESGQTANGVTVDFDDRTVAAELLADSGAQPCA